jgi:plasmid maintenance system antidote protein VapI
MASTSQFEPLWASAPGETIAEMLRRKKIDFAVFASDMGGSEDDAQCLLDGACAIDRDVAERLHDVIGGSIAFWLRREAQYRDDIARLHGIREEEDAAAWLRELPTNDMIKLGWISRVQSKAGQAKELLRFFAMPSINAWREAAGSVQSVVAFRTTATFKSSPGAVAAWLRRGEISASRRTSLPFNKAKLISAIPELRKLTRVKDPEKFIPQLETQCEQCGVALVIERAPQGCRASGATKFLSNGTALVLMSFRYRSDDHFWFTFFHEIGHLVLHDQSALFIEGADFMKTHEEREADQFSEDTLVPPEFKQELLLLPADHRKIQRFAKKIGVSPGIVLGQLQHAGKIGREKLNALKKRYVWTN